jgi:hypothetical protein
VVGERKEVGFYFRWMRNSDSFVKERAEVQERLGFCWRLEGVKFERLTYCVSLVRILV